MKILAIDPGNNESAYIIWDGYTIIDKAKISNEELLVLIEGGWNGLEFVTIEMIASYGFPMGQTTIDTVFWIGRFLDVAVKYGYEVKLLFRKTIVIHHCRSPRASDAVVRQALINKYGEDSTKKKPNELYITPNGTWMNGDLWSAFALATYWTEQKALIEYSDSEINLLSTSLQKYI